ncbi:folate-binding protein, partial [Acinetobacter baumannii]
EMDWLRTAVHLSKGCYRGQETVAKVHNLGHPPRRVVALQLDGSDSVLPARGDVVRVGDDAIGAVTSVAVHFEEGPIALALVKRTA